jgi:hypothetical protein
MSRAGTKKSGVKTTNVSRLFLLCALIEQQNFDKKGVRHHPISALLLRVFSHQRKNTDEKFKKGDYISHASLFCVLSHQHLKPKQKYEI